MKALKIVAFVFVIFIAVVGGSLWSCGNKLPTAHLGTLHQPSDDVFERRFYTQRADLERLVAMMDEDTQMSRIASDFMWRQDKVAWPRPESEWGISKQRWDDYKNIFARADFDGGTFRAEKSSDVSVIVWRWGIVPAGISVSYLHCGLPAKGFVHTEPPCTEQKSSGSGLYPNSSSNGYRYKKITEDWYIYEQSK